jgi:ankyrin repeat protein
MQDAIDDLFDAVKHGKVQTVTNLLNAHAEVRNSINTLKPTIHSNTECVLSDAAWGGHVDMVKLLLEYGADVNITGNYEWTALHCAVHMNRFEVAKILIDNGADVSANPHDTPLMVAAGFIGTKSPCQIDMFQLLIDSGADVNAVNYDGMTLLHLAARACHTVAVEFLLGNSVNMMFTRDNSRMEPIHYACTNFRTSTWRRWALVQEPAEPEGIFDHKDYSTVDMRPVIKLLLEHGANVNALGTHRRTPLMDAISSRDERRVRLLLDMDADLTSIPVSGETILEIAAGPGNNKAILKMIQDEPVYRFKVSMRVALAMGRHDRVGENSVLQCVHDELVREFGDYVYPLP